MTLTANIEEIGDGGNDAGYRSEWRRVKLGAGVVAYLGLFIEQLHLERVDVVRRQSLTPGFDGARLPWTTPKCLA